jgi:hypothetical protein
VGAASHLYSRQLRGFADPPPIGLNALQGLERVVTVMGAYDTVKEIIEARDAMRRTIGDPSINIKYEG